MTIQEALQIVIELATQNVIPYEFNDQEGTNAEHERQTEAINLVEEMAANQYGDD